MNEEARRLCLDLLVSGKSQWKVRGTLEAEGWGPTTIDRLLTVCLAERDAARARRRLAGRLVGVAVFLLSAGSFANRAFFAAEGVSIISYGLLALGTLGLLKALLP